MTIAAIITRGLHAGPSGIRQLLTAGYIAAAYIPDPTYRYDFGGGGLLGAKTMTINSFDLFLRIMDKLQVATSIFDDAEVHLFQNDLSITPETILADFIEADYTGYAAQALEVPPVVFLGPDGHFIAQFPHNVFFPTGTALTNTLYGFWVEGTFGGVGARLGFAARFIEPAIFTGPEDAVVAEPRLIIAQPTID